VTNRSFKRNRPARESGRRILIACEGLVTEPKYLEAIRQDRRLTRVRIFIGLDEHTNPCCHKVAELVESLLNL
jgi:hypothetical protein